MDALTGIDKIIRKNAFDQKKNKPELKFNLGSALIGLRITGPCTLTNERNESYNPLPYDPLQTLWQYLHGLTLMSFVSKSLNGNSRKQRVFRLGKFNVDPII